MLASIPPPPITEVHLGPVRLTVFGLVVAVAVLVGLHVTRRRYERDGGDPELVDRVLLPAILVGFVGARLAYVVTNTGRFQGRWLEVLAVWQGGLALFGGLTFGTLTALWLVRRHQADLGAFAGAAAIGVPLAQAIGRPADYFSQELYGTPSTLPWAVEVPERFRPAAYADAATFHPAFFYEALWSLMTVVVLLWLERRGLLRRGQLFLGYMVAYGVGRFALELLRTDTTFRLLGISRNGWVAVGLMVGGIVGMVWLRRRHDPQSDTTPSTGTPVIP
jgi:prolipoprotein diacylglyceryl transferase